MFKPSIYTKNSQYYDLIYGSKDYKEESEIIRKLIVEYKISKGKNLLDVGCGTGQHLKYFSHDFDCVGLDINPKLLKIASGENKNVSFHKGNMLSFKLEMKFDVITCLFSAIGYVKTLRNLEKTLRNMFHHLNVGGLLILEPWFTRDSKSFVINSPFLTTFNNKKIKIARLSMAKIKGNLSIMDTHYLVAEESKRIQYFKEKHTLGLFEKQDVIRIMKKIGFSPIFLDKGLSQEDRGLFIGKKY